VVNRLARKRAAAKTKAQRRAAKNRAAKRPARKAAKKRVARRPARKAAKKRVARRPAHKAAKKRVAKRPARKAAKRPAPQAVKKRAARGPAAKLRVRRAGAPASFPQREGASPRLALLFDMARARTAVLAAIQGLLPSSAEQPHSGGKWNTRQHVLHLIQCDELYAADVVIALRGETPAAASYTNEDNDRANAEAQARLGHLTWDEALRRLHAARQRLLETLEPFPEDPEVWTGSHMVARILRSAVSHDRHHADAIKRWRTEANV
jgi:uncharacterized damage-inducible protein DinB